MHSLLNVTTSDNDINNNNDITIKHDINDINDINIKIQ